MGLESGSFIATLVATNPVGATDPKSQGDDHIRLIKKALQNSFPKISTTVEATPAELNLVVGATQGLATLSASLASLITLVGQMGTFSASVTSSDITGSIRAPVLQTTGVSAGTYTAATVVVDAKGRITAASSGTASGSESYIYIRDEQTSGTHAGSSSATTWHTRVLNTKVSDAGSLATLSSNQITLAAGTYRFRASAPAFQSLQHKTRLANITDTSYIYGTSEWTGVTADISNRSFVTGRFTIAGSKVFELQHYINSAAATWGLGRASNIASINEVYAEIELWKEL